MKTLLAKYRLVVKFILTFVLVYAALSILYHVYLDVSKNGNYYPDYLTNLTARQTELVLDSFGYDTKIMAHDDEPSLKLILNGNYVARVVEGCNSISVVILFLAFIFAFADTWKPTMFYALAGSVLIYSVNIFRIAFLAIGLLEYPEKEKIMHDIFFPLIIYGMLFLLWLFWVNRYQKIKTKNV